MYDPVYRLGIAWQNAAYNQPPHLGFYIGGGVSNLSKPDSYIVKANTASDIHSEKEEKAVIYSKNSTLMIHSKSIIQHIAIYSTPGNLIYQHSNVGTQNFSTKIPDNVSIMIVRIKTEAGIETAKIVKQEYVHL
jgi:rhamnogalacturonan endolyase